MSEIKNRDRILEAIDQLRRRKARPDIQRICNFLMRRFSISSSDTKADLQKCVEKEIVLKVEYKGNISYRNAAKKYSHLKRDSQGDICENNKANRKFAGLLNNAIAELIVNEPDYLELGVPGPELIKNILSKDSVRYTKKYVSILLEKELENGGLIKMENGNYLVGPTKNDSQNSEHELINALYHHKSLDDCTVQVKREKKKISRHSFKKEREELVDTDDGKMDKSGENANLRVGSRRKRAKKVFDPSDNNIPRKRGRPAGSLNKATIEKQLAKLSEAELKLETRTININRDQGGVCSVCHNNKKSSNERLVSCRECSNKAHLGCLNGDDMILRMYPDNTWQCPHCKTCVICYETSDAGYLNVCWICADAYHAGCHEPHITEKVKCGSKWLCINCQTSEQLAVNEIQPNAISTESEVKVNDANDLSGSREATSQSPLTSGNSTPSNYISPPQSPTPPMLSPQANQNGNRTSNPASPEGKSNLSDSQSFKDFDYEVYVDPTIPDATDWSCDDVCNYFAQFFPDEAKIFKEQEIDGHSLLLMRRMDVLNHMKFKLGPALKIYRHILKLQFRRDDPRLYWL